MKTEVTVANLAKAHRKLSSYFVVIQAALGQIIGKRLFHRWTLEDSILLGGFLSVTMS